MCDNDIFVKNLNNCLQVDWIDEYLSRDENLDAAEKEADYERWQDRCRERAREVVHEANINGGELTPIGVFHLVRYIGLLEERLKAKTEEG